MVDWFEQFWRTPGYLGLGISIIIAITFQLLLLRTVAGVRFRMNLTFGVVCGVLYLLSKVFPSIGLVAVGDVLEELSVLGWGILFIYISNQVLFRVVLPIFRTTSPKIVQDILFLLICIIWGFTRLRHAGVDLSGLITTSAVITGIIAFSMQETLGNILGGLALQLDNSVSIGDWIKVDDVRGKVIDVHWRYTSVLTNNGVVVVIPNSTLMKSKVDVYCSEDKPLVRRWIPFATDYSASPTVVIEAVEKAIREAKIDCVAMDPAPQCLLTNIQDGYNHFALRYWQSNPLLDDYTDSEVRLHLTTCLQREDLVFGRPCLEVSLTTESEERDAGKRDKEVARRIQILRSVKLFAGLQVNELQQIAVALRVAKFTKNDVMTKQGDVAHWLYVMVSGEAEVWYETSSGERNLIATFRKGDVFGEMGLMTGEPRHATVIARTDSECYRIDKYTFETILLARPELALEFARLIDERQAVLKNLKFEENSPGQDRQATILSNIRRFFHLPRKEG